MFLFKGFFSQTDDISSLANNIRENIKVAQSNLDRYLDEHDVNRKRKIQEIVETCLCVVSEGLGDISRRELRAKLPDYNGLEQSYKTVNELAVSLFGEDEEECMQDIQAAMQDVQSIRELLTELELQFRLQLQCASIDPSLGDRLDQIREYYRRVGDELSRFFSEGRDKEKSFKAMCEGYEEVKGKYLELESRYLELENVILAPVSIQKGQVTLRQCNMELIEKIKSTPEFQDDLNMLFIEEPFECLSKGITDVPKQFLDVYIPQHKIFENVYLGNLRALKSIDAEFVRRYGVSDTAEEILDRNHPLHNDLAQKLDKQGCFTLGIRKVLSATKFKPQESVQENDWSRFDPQLKNKGIECMQLPVDDDEFAWEGLKPHLEDAFNFIDNARGLGEPLLIHCVKGASRSVTVLTAYLMNRFGVSCDRAFNFIKTQRSLAELKPSIYEGLRGYEAELRNKFS